MNLINPVQIKGGKKLFEDVDTIKNQITTINNTLDNIGNVTENEITELKNSVNTNQSTIESVKNNVTELTNNKVSTVSISIPVTTPKQSEFTVDLSNITGKQVSTEFPLKLVVNGIQYSTEDFTLNFAESKLTWISTEENGGFDFDVEDNIVLEIPLKNSEN